MIVKKKASPRLPNGPVIKSRLVALLTEETIGMARKMATQDDSSYSAFMEKLIRKEHARRNNGN